MTKRQQSSAQVCLTKLQKLKNSINFSTDYSCLERCMEKLESVKSLVFSMETSKSKRDIMFLINTCEQLIKEKVKFFKKKIKKIANSRIMSLPDTDQSLKHCRSTDNIQANRTYHKMDYRQEKRVIRDTELFQQETETRYLKEVQSSKALKSLINGKFSSVNSELQNFKSKLVEIENKVYKEDIQMVFQNKNSLILEKYETKLKDKMLESQQLKTRNRYLEDHNQQLKNRILNEQRRQNDYIDTLKSQINELSRQLQNSYKEKQTSFDYISSLEKHRQLQAQQTKKLIKRYEEERLKRDQEIFMAEAATNTQFQEMKRQLEHLSRQELYIKEIEKMVHCQSLERLKTDEKYAIVLRENDDLRVQIRKAFVDNDKLQETIDSLTEGVRTQKNSLQKDECVLKRLEQELYETKKQLLILQKEKQAQAAAKETVMKEKALKLKQVRSMLQELN